MENIHARAKEENRDECSFTGMENRQTNREHAARAGGRTEKRRTNRVRKETWEHQENREHSECGDIRRSENRREADCFEC